MGLLALEHRTKGTQSRPCDVQTAPPTGLPGPLGQEQRSFSSQKRKGPRSFSVTNDIIRSSLTVSSVSAVTMRSKNAFSIARRAASQKSATQTNLGINCAVSL